MLTGQQRDEFDRYGIVRMPGAVGKAAADEMLTTVWDCLRDRYHLHRGAPDTWPEPQRQSAGGLQQIGGAHRYLGTHHIPKSVTFEQVGNTAVCGAVDDLLGSGNWQRPERWGSLLVTFPESTERWEVPCTNWHLDFPASQSPSGPAGVRIFTCLAKLPECGGGTVFVAGSHRLVEKAARAGEILRSADARMRLIRAYPWVKALCSRDEKADRVRRFMREGTRIDGVEVRVVEMVGEPGDVVLVHPMMLHAPALNCSSMPRFVVQTTAFRKGVEPFKLYR
ncbi:phytanoyl-CoA dioxygenase family protein [Candidatus Binatus sp.]|uniref:phytanoyl-CoA dioxygenase family protein n=1 Tax=Candidatus Binatus sp. TaxID=2811406 RepID=UPI003C979ECE